MRSPIPVADSHGHIGTHPDFPAYHADPAEMIAVMDLLNIEKLAVTSTLACYNDCPRGNADYELCADGLDQEGITAAYFCFAIDAQALRFTVHADEQHSYAGIDENVA